MPILQKRKVHYAKDSKTHGMKKIKFCENLVDNSSSDSDSENETFKNKISSKENKVSKVTEERKTSATKKAKSRQIQKYTSSSESESENETAKSETSPKLKNLKVSEVPKTYGMKKVESGKIHKYTSSESESEDETPKTKTSPKKQAILKNGSPKKCFDFSTSLTKDKTLNADEGSRNSKESTSKNLELTCSDSDEPPLVIDEDGDNDLLGLQKYMKDELRLNVSSPKKAKLKHDASQSMPDPKNGHDAPQFMPDKNSNNVGSSSESESDIEGTQETTYANNCRQIKKYINKKLNNAGSESESDSEKIKKRDTEKDANFKENGNNSSSVDSESDSDIEGTQEIVNKKIYKKVTGSPKKNSNENVNTVISQSESESDVEETQKPAKTNNDNKDVKTKSNTDKISNITSESEFHSGEKQETKIAKNFKKDLKIEKVINQVSKVVSSDSESDKEETQETESKSKYIQGEETNLNEQSNLNTSETQLDEEETQKALKNECGLPRINYDLQMLSKTKKTNNSDNSDFELTLESGASHEEKEPASSDIDSRKSKVSSNTIKKTNASRNKKLILSKKAPLPVAEGIRESDDSASEKELTLENGSLHEGEELASTDTDLKNPALVDGSLKRTKKKSRTSPRKAPLPVDEVKSENELASGIDSSHEDEEQASSVTDARKSKTDAKLKKASTSKKKKLKSPEKALALPTVAKVRHKLNDSEPKSEEDEVSSDDSADDEEDLNESLFHSTQPTYIPTEEEKMTLASIQIQIRHRVLPQHQIESTAGTRTLKQREKVAFEKHATLKRGTFDSTEDKQIKKNWKMFCKNHDWNPKNPKPFLFMKHKNKEALMSQVNRKRFMQILAHGLPNRSLYSVFQRFKNLYDPHRTCRYTEDEDRVIVDFISTYNAVDSKDRKFAELASILKRTRASVWRRYRVLKKKQLLRVDDALCHSSR